MKRQLFRLYAFNLLGVGTLILPTVLAPLGKFAFVSIIIGTFFLYIFMLMTLNVREGLRKSKIFNLWYGSFEIAQAAFLTWVFTRLVKENLVENEGDWLIMLLIVLVGAYAISGGVRARARVYEVLFWAVIISLAIMFAFAAKDIKFDYWQIKDTAGIKEILIGAYLIFISGTSIFNLYFLEDADRKDKLAAVSKAIVLSMGILAVTYAILLGSFGKFALLKMNFPVVELMGNVQFKGAFFKRADALMLGDWFFTLFALLNMSMCYGAKSLEDLRGRKCKRWHIIITAALTFGVALLFEYGGLDVNRYIWCLTKVGVPLLIAIVLVGSLCGCGARELENRWFPFVAAVDYQEENYNFYYVNDEGTVGGDKKESDEENSDNIGQIKTGKSQSFMEAVSLCDQSMAKSTDVNHLKVMLIGKSLYEDDKAYGNLMEELADGNKFPRNTYVMLTEDIENCRDADGEYLEEYLEKTAKDRDQSLVTLGNLMDNYYNGFEKVQIPEYKTE